MTKLVARLLAIHPDISQKYKMSDISKGVASTLWPAKKIYEIKLCTFWVAADSME
jgi:hypothetical protein